MIRWLLLALACAFSTASFAQSPGPVSPELVAGCTVMTTPGTFSDGTREALTCGTDGSLRTSQGAVVGGTTTAAVGCGSSIVYDASTNGLTQLVAASGTTAVYVCGYTVFSAGTVNVNLKSGDTGGSCANSVAMTPAYQFTAQTGVADGSPVYRGLKTPAGKALCLNTSAGIAVQAIVYYTQF